MKLPEKFVKTVTNAWGAQGEQWLRELPRLVLECQQQWSLQKLELIENLSFNCVFRAYRGSDLSLVILKLSFASDFEQEIHALQVYQGQGAVKLLEVDLSKKACLLEKLEPGKTLKTFFPENDDKAVLIAVEVMKKLHNNKLPKDLSSFPTIEKWLSVFDTPEQFPFPSLIKKAKRRVLRLMENPRPNVLLHGDLHHENILQNNNEWVSIDPKGVVGEVAYEMGAFVRNPVPGLLQQPNALVIIQQRIELFSVHLKVEKSRLVDWCFVQAVLAACWAYEDKDDWEFWLKYAELLEGMGKESFNLC